MEGRTKNLDKTGPFSETPKCFFKPFFAMERGGSSAPVWPVSTFGSIYFSPTFSYKSTFWPTNRVCVCVCVRVCVSLSWALGSEKCEKWTVFRISFFDPVHKQKHFWVRNLKLRKVSRAPGFEMLARILLLHYELLVQRGHQGSFRTPGWLARNPDVFLLVCSVRHFGVCWRVVRQYFAGSRRGWVGFGVLENWVLGPFALRFTSAGRFTRAKMVLFSDTNMGF